MLVKLTTHRFGPGYYQAAGTVLDLPDDEAKTRIAAGDAEKVTNPPPTDEPPKTATTPEPATAADSEPASTADAGEPKTPEKRKK